MLRVSAAPVDQILKNPLIRLFPFASGKIIFLTILHDIVMEDEFSLFFRKVFQLDLPLHLCNALSIVENTIEFFDFLLNLCHFFIVFWGFATNENFFNVLIDHWLEMVFAKDGYDVGGVYV